MKKAVIIASVAAAAVAAVVACVIVGVHKCNAELSNDEDLEDMFE